MRTILACLLALVASSCSPDAPPEECVILSTRLHADLASDSRESICRAMSFIEKTGGPRIPEGTRTLTQWIEVRVSSLDWLESRPASEVRMLDQQYVEFCKLWAPFYAD